MGMKEAYHKKADAQLREWQDWIERTKYDPTVLRAEIKVDRQRAVERLEDCHRIARVRLDELRSSQEERWEFAKQAVERAMIDLKKALDDSGASLSGKNVQLQAGRAHIYELYHRKGF